MGKNHRATYAFALMLLFHVFLTFTVVVQNDNFEGASRMLLLFVGPLILFGAIGLQALPPTRKQMAVVTMYFLIVGATEFMLPKVYSAVALSIMDRANITDGHRGISFLTPEPTYAAISVIYFLLLAWWSGKHWGFKYRWVEPALGLCLLATGSVYTILLLSTLAVVRWPRSVTIVGVITGLIVYLNATIPMANDDSIRVLVVASRLLAIDSSGILESISYLDPSIGSRLATNIASFLALFHFPLGLGLDCSAVPIAFRAVGFDFAFDNEVLSQQLEYSCIKPQSYGASIMIGFGVLSFFYCALLIVFVKYSSGKIFNRIWLYPLVLAVTMLLVQGQISNPIPWLLIYFAFVSYPNHSIKC